MIVAGADITATHGNFRKRIFPLPRGKNPCRVKYIQENSAVLTEISTENDM